MKKYGLSKDVKEKYIRLKTKDLIEFGYTDLTEQEVEEELNKVLSGIEELTIIGEFIEDEELKNATKDGHNG